MKVECIQNKSEEWDYQVSIGDIYVVIEIYFEVQKKDSTQLVSFRLDAEDLEVPALFPASIFKVIDQSIPGGWIFSQSDGGLTSIGPKSWAREGFWEDYFNDEETAVSDFEREVNRLHEQENL